MNLFTISFIHSHMNWWGLFEDIPDVIGTWVFSSVEINWSSLEVWISKQFPTATTLYLQWGNFIIKCNAVEITDIFAYFNWFASKVCLVIYDDFANSKCSCSYLRWVNFCCIIENCVESSRSTAFSWNAWYRFRELIEKLVYFILTFNKINVFQLILYTHLLEQVLISFF